MSRCSSSLISFRPATWARKCAIFSRETRSLYGAAVPVGQFAMKSAFLLGAERVIGIDRFPERLADGPRPRQARKPSTMKKVDVYEALKEMTGGRGPDSCIDAVGMESHAPSLAYAYDRAKQAMMLESDRPLALRQAIQACRNGGTVSVIGVYSGFIDKFPMGSLMNRSLTIQDGPMSRTSLSQPSAGPDREGRNRSKLCDHSHDGT